MSIDINSITNALVSHAKSLGIFDSVNEHEPENAPAGLGVGIWVQGIAPAAGGSGLVSTTGLLIYNVRIYTSMVSEPAGAIDPQLLSAVDSLIAAYSGDFTLGGNVREVDLMGEFNTPLSAEAGYLEQSGQLYRVMTITVPIVINDIWDQAP